MHKKWTTLVVLAVVAALVSLPALADRAFSGKIKSVKDGDTMVVVHKGAWVDVQLAGIDAPELKQEYGQEARDYLTSLAKKQRAEVEVVRSRRTGELVAYVSVNGKDLSAAMVEAGFAWSKESSSELAAAQNKAKSQKEGLWASADPTPPWNFRSAGSRSS